MDGRGSYLSCNTTGVWYSVRTVTGAASGNSPPPYFVVYAAGQGSGWSVVAANSSWSIIAQDLQDNGFRPPVAPAPVDTLDALSWVAADVSSSVLMIGTPSGGVSGNLQVGRIAGTSHAFTAATVVGLPGQTTSSPSPAVRGVSFIGSDGWILLRDTNISSNHATSETIVLRTSDAGTSWIVTYKGSSR